MKHCSWKGKNAVTNQEKEKDSHSPNNKKKLFSLDKVIFQWNIILA